MPRTSTRTPKTEGAAPRRFVNVDTPFDELVRWDREGDQIFFNDEPGRLVKLAPEQVSELSMLTRAKYTQACATCERLNAVDPEWDKIQKSLEINQFDQVSSYDKLQTTGKGDFVTRAARPDKLQYWKDKGYVVATPEMVASTGMARKEGHYEITRDGRTELVLMAAPAEVRDRIQKEKLDHNKAIGEAIGASQSAELASNGMPAVKGV